MHFVTISSAVHLSVVECHNGPITQYILELFLELHSFLESHSSGHGREGFVEIEHADSADGQIDMIVAAQELFEILSKHQTIYYAQTIYY